MTGKERSARNIIIITSVINIALNYYLIPQYGTGAAYATSISTVIWNALAVIKIKRLRVYLHPSSILMSNHASKINFFIVGAAKGGTTTVFDRLNSRDDVYLSPLKEPNYYSTDIDTGAFSTEFRANTNLDLTSYFSQDPLPVKQIGFIRDFTLYDRLFATAPETAKLIGECSTSYLYSTVAAEKIHAAHPDAKILIMLRHPVDRLYSHYMMARKYGFTSLPLIDAVKKDMTHPKPGWGSSEIFVDLGLYTDHIARYKAHFPASQIRIMFTRDLRSEEKWSELLEWLGLPNTHTEILERSDANGGQLNSKALIAPLHLQYEKEARRPNR